MAKLKSVIDRLCDPNGTSEGDAARLHGLETRERAYEPNDDIVRSGSANGGIHLVRDGWCCRYRILPDGRRHILGFHLPGDLVGLDTVHMASSPNAVTTLTQTSVSTVSSAALLGLCREAPAVGQAMLSEMARESTLANERMVSLGRRTAYERLAHMLLELCLRLKREHGTAASEYQIPLTHDLLADASGLTPIHVNRTLRRLQEEGLVAVENGRRMTVRLADFGGLATASRFDDNVMAMF
jgi:CRP-like cAMP-binding protein